MRHAFIMIGTVTVVALASLRCGSDSGGGSGLDGTKDAAGNFGGASTGGNGGLGGGLSLDAAIDIPPPPEKELESSYRAPVATGKYVWSANPDSGRVALVDAISLDVKIAEAGFAPTYMAAIQDPKNPDANVAIVLNVLSHDATLFRVAADGKISQKTLKTHTGANAWAVSAGGHFAIAWSDATLIDKPDPTDGFQDITVISLEPGKEASTILTVGYRPTRLAFAADEKRAFAVTEPGVSVVGLDGIEPSVDGLVKVSDDPLENPASRDVTITPDGSFALVRRDGSPAVSLVPLGGGQRVDITLSGEVTDLDLSDDGTRAVAVVREKSEVDVLPIPGVATDPSLISKTTIEGETLGSVALSPDANVALLYTNAISNDHLTILNLAAGADFLKYRTVALKAPVSAVFPAADAKHAVVLQSTLPGSTKAGAFSVVSTAAVISPKIVGTDAPPTSVAIEPAPNSEHALVTVRDDTKKVFGAYMIRLSNLQVDFVKLASPPLASGVVNAAGKGYVAQQHPEGRITFVDLADGSVRTLTGFELGAKVVE